MMEVVVTTGAIRRAKLQSNHQHQQTNTQLFTDHIPFPSPNQQCQSTEEKLVTLCMYFFVMLLHLYIYIYKSLALHI